MRKNYFYLVLAIVCSINVMAQNIPSYVPKDGLVGFWPFNGNANDESGNGNHGTVNGATLTADRNGVANSAYSFDGIDDYIEVSDNKTLDITQSVTISVWLYKPNFKQRYEAIMTKEINGTNTNNITYKFQLSENNELLHYTSRGYLNKTKFSNQQWHNFIGICTIDSIKLYLDGALVEKSQNQFNFNNLTTNNLPINIGRLTYYEPISVGNERMYFEGKLDDIAIYNRALSDQEIKQLYEGCTKETATSSNFNTLMYTTNAPVNLIASPTGGTFSGNGVTNNAFNPSKAKLGKNTVKYNFKNTTGCADSTNFTMILVDTLGNKCSTYDTILKINFKLTTGIKAGQQTSMNVYPNPTSDKLIIETNDIQALSGYSYKIADLQGKEVYNALATSTKTEISLKSIGAKGMYILHIVDEKGVSIENKKIVLE